jgi:hypothetical protein
MAPRRLLPRCVASRAATHAALPVWAPCWAAGLVLLVPSCRWGSCVIMCRTGLKVTGSLADTTGAWEICRVEDTMPRYACPAAAALPCFST